jgi:AcrR family transcriptional regulator
MQSRSRETRQRIMKAALECFARSGYNACSVAEICSTADVSKGAFYHHFLTKQALFLALLDEWLGSIDALLEASRQGAETVPQALYQMSEQMTRIFAQARGQIPIFLEFWTQASHDPVIWRALLEPYQRYQKYFSQLVQTGIAEGSLKPVDADNSARLIVSLALGMLLQGLLDPEGAQWDQATRQSVQYILDGIENKKI